MVEAGPGGTKSPASTPLVKYANKKTARAA